MMKFIVDNQLPGALAQFLQKRGCDAGHVLNVGLASASDIDICRYAELHDCIIISKDEDFLYLVRRPNSKIRLIWVRLGNCRTSSLLEAFEHHWPRIVACLQAGDRIVEIR